jgi:hypothetical protein
VPPVPPPPELPPPEEPPDDPPDDSPPELSLDTESVSELLAELDCDEASVDWPVELGGCCVVAHTGM